MRVALSIIKEEMMFHLTKALIDLNHPAHYFKLGPIQISAGNAIVILLMLVIFVIAIAAPFPGDKNE